MATILGTKDTDIDYLATGSLKPAFKRDSMKGLSFTARDEKASRFWVFPLLFHEQLKRICIGSDLRKRRPS